MTESNETKVISAIERLGIDATTTQVSELTGLSKQTVERWAKNYGYKRAYYAGPWLNGNTEPTASNLDSSEVIDALNRIADALSQAPAPRMDQISNDHSTIEKFVYQFRLMTIEEKDLETVGKNMPAQDADYAVRDHWARRVLSYLFAPELQKQ